MTMRLQADLVTRLTLEEKVGLMAADSNTKVSSCNMMDHGVPRLGIPPCVRACVRVCACFVCALLVLIVAVQPCNLHR